MTAAAPLDHDPDVLQAIEDLGSYAARLRRVEEQLLETDEVTHHRRWMGLRAEGSQCREQIKLRADRLQVPLGAMLLILDEEARLRTMYRRKPPRDMLAKALATAVGVGERDLRQKRHDAKVAAVEARAAERHAEAALAAHRAFRGLGQ